MPLTGNWANRELAELDDGDRYIADGDYFITHKDHLLGDEDGSFSGDDEVGKARSWRYKVTGDLPTTLPPLTPRPICTACVLNNIAPREAANFQTVTRTDDGIPDDVDDELRHALGDHAQTQVMREGDGGVADRDIAGVGVDVAHQRSQQQLPGSDHLR